MPYVQAQVDRVTVNLEQVERIPNKIRIFVKIIRLSLTNILNLQTKKVRVVPVE